MKFSGPLRRWADGSPHLGIFLRRVQRAVRQHRYGKDRIANVAMLHAGRCGSSVLSDLLKQHPGFRWVDEPFEGMIPAYYRTGAKNRARHVIGNRMWQARSRYFGFDSKYMPEQHLNPDLANTTPEGYVDLLEELGFTHFVLLDRSNQLRRAVSTAIGSKTGVWNTFGAPHGRTAVHIDITRFHSYGLYTPLTEWLASLEATYSTLRKRLQGRRLLELTYEDDVERDPTIGYQRVCDLLGIAPHPVQVRLKKMNPYPVHELIENYDEVAQALSGTPYEWMLTA